MLVSGRVLHANLLLASLVFGSVAAHSNRVPQRRVVTVFSEPTL